MLAPALPAHDALHMRQGAAQKWAAIQGSGRLCAPVAHKGIMASVQEVVLPPFSAAFLMRSVVPMQIGYEDKHVEAMACKNSRACAKSFPCRVFQVRTAHLSCQLCCQAAPLTQLLTLGWCRQPCTLDHTSIHAKPSPCCQPAPLFQVEASVTSQCHLFIYAMFSA